MNVDRLVRGSRRDSNANNAIGRLKIETAHLTAQHLDLSRKTAISASFARRERKEPLKTSKNRRTGRYAKRHNIRQHCSTPPATD